MTELLVPMVFFTNQEFGRMLNANMNYATPSDGPRVFIVNDRHYIKKGKETFYETGHSGKVYLKYMYEGDESQFIYFRMGVGLIGAEFHFILPYREDEYLFLSYDVSISNYAGEMKCSSVNHDVKISDSGNVVVAEKTTGKPIYVMRW